MKRKAQPNRESTVSDKYQAVIPKDLRQRMGIRRGVKLRWTSLGQAGLLVELVDPKARSPKSWAEYSYGLGKEVWEGVDAMEYINELRHESKAYQRARGIID